MKKTNKTVAIVITLLMISSALLIFSTSTETTTKAAIPSNMLQYEWPQIASTPTSSYFSDGPAPNAPNIKWKTQIPYVGGNPVAFNGLIFTQSAALGTVYALDADTGAIVWTLPVAQANVLGTGITKVDDTYMLIGDSCIKIADGTIVWKGPPGFAYSPLLGGVGYIPELKMLMDGSYGWNLANPSQPPTLVWNRTSENIYGDMTCLAYADEKLYCGTYDNFLICIDALNGTTLWVTPSTGGFIYGATYIDGKIVHGELDNNMHAWDANTGEMLWTYNPGTWYGMWASAAASAYGMVYEKNQDTYLYAINATTGEMVWRAKGPGIGYSNTLVIADGKVYCQMGENQYRDFETGEYAYSEYDCYDAFTGELIWTMPLENGAPFDLECIAYGNLYVVPNKPTPQEEGVWSYSLGGAMSLGEIWCISSEVTDWPMYHADPEHSAEGAGPTNLALKWTFKGDATIQSSPTLVDGVCYFGTQLGTIYAIDANTATELWSFQTDHWVKSTVAVVNGKLYTGTDDGNIYCLNAANGNQLWKKSAGGIKRNPLNALTYVGADNSRSSPIVVGGRVYVGSLDGNLYCFNANSGAVIWKFQTGGPIQATPTIVNNEIYIPSSTPIPNGTVYKLDINGNVLWQKEFPYVLDKTPGSGYYMLASATVAEGKVFVRNGLRLNYALNATTGDTIWTYDGEYNPGTPFQLGGVTQFMPMLYKYGKLYFNDFYGITCLDASNGTKIWHTWLSRENLAQGLSYSYQRIYTVNEFGVLYVLDALSGAKLSYYEFVPARSQLHCMPVPYNGSLYVGANDWNMYCFGEARLMPAAEPSSPSGELEPEVPSEQPTEQPSGQPTEQPSGQPTEQPTGQATEQPTETPSGEPTGGAFALSITEIAIIAAVAVASVIGVGAYWLIKKRK